MSLLFIFLWIALTLGAHLAQEQVYSPVFSGAFFAACLGYVLLNGRTAEFLQSFSRARTLHEEKKVIVAGEEVGGETLANKQEDAFLERHDFVMALRRRVIPVVVLFLSFLALTRSFGHNPTDFIVVLATGYLVLAAFFVGHLLGAVLAITLWVMTAVNSAPWPLLLGWGMATFCALALISISRDKKIAELKIPSASYGRLLLAMVVFMGTVGLALAWLPKQISSVDKQLPLPPRTYAHVQEAERTLTNMQNFERDLSGKRQLPGDFSQLLSQLELRLNRVQELLQKSELTSVERTTLRADLHSLARDTQKLQQLQRSMLVQLKTTKVDPKLAENYLRQLNQQGALLQHLERMREQVGSGGEGSQRQEFQRLSGELEDRIQNGTATPADHERLLEAFKQASGELERENARIAFEKADEVAATQEPGQQAADDFVPDAKKDFNWERLLLMAGSVVAVIGFAHFLKKKGIHAVEAADPEILAELREEWKRAMAQKLSPRDEVILHYNLLHDGLQRVHYQDQETPPSCIVKLDLAEFNEELASPGESVAEIFARTFYGEKDVQRADLKQFRGSLKAILKTYQIY